jgi:hypothetical protein
MLIWINLNGKYKLARVLEFRPVLIQNPASHKCHVYIRFQTMESSRTDNTLYIDRVNWHPVNNKQFVKKCEAFKLPFFAFTGTFNGFKPM